MKVNGFGIANYRSFDSSGEFVRDIGKVNVFIGKNNSGKSNVLRFLKEASKHRDQQNSPWPAVDRHNMTSDSPQLAVCATLDVNDLKDLSWAPRQKESMCKKVLDIWLGEAPANVTRDNPLDLECLTDRNLMELHNTLGNRQYGGGWPARGQLLRDTHSVIASRVQSEFHSKIGNIIYIPAIREIRMAAVQDTENKRQADMDLSGSNLITKLRIMQHPRIGKDSDQQKFSEIQEMVRKLLDIPNLKMEIPTEENDIHFRMRDGVRLPLASFGTGIHELVIICSTLALYENCYVCIEEPEIHLHPELLRRFLQFIHTTSNSYFIATHSNIFLDTDESNSIYHVHHDGDSSHIVRSQANKQSRAILRDLGYRASDLLQTNGIIWVEGPSDRFYIKKWLDLLGSKFVEGINYSIMFYGGACLANLSFAEIVSADQFIDLLKINPNVIVVIDRDGDSSDVPLREYKQRIEKEIGEYKCWITKGREIENYLPPTLLQRFFGERFPGKVRPFKFNYNHKIDNMIKRALPEDHFTYSRNKRVYSQQICEKMIADDLDILDLLSWIERLDNAIKSWNPK